MAKCMFFMTIYVVARIASSFIKHPSSYYSCPSTHNFGVLRGSGILVLVHMIAYDMLSLYSSLMLASPKSTTDTILYYLDHSRVTTETSLARFRPLPLNCNNAYLPRFRSFSERVCRPTTPSLDV